MLTQAVFNGRKDVVHFKMVRANISRNKILAANDANKNVENSRENIYKSHDNLKDDVHVRNKHQVRIDENCDDRNRMYEERGDSDDNSDGLDDHYFPEQRTVKSKERRKNIVSGAFGGDYSGKRIKPQNTSYTPTMKIPSNKDKRRTEISEQLPLSKRCKKRKRCTSSTSNI